MKIAIGSDRSGFDLKESVKGDLLNGGYDVTDVALTDPNGSMTYYEAAAKVAHAIQSGAYEKGLVFCGSGAGVAVTANKFKGIYCVLCESLFTAEKCSVINNANVMAMGNLVVGHGQAFAMAKAFLDSSFVQGMPEERQQQVAGMFAALQEIEDGNFK